MAQPDIPNEKALAMMLTMDETQFIRLMQLFQAKIITTLEVRQLLGLQGRPPQGTVQREGVA